MSWYLTHTLAQVGEDPPPVKPATPTGPAIPGKTTGSEPGTTAAPNPDGPAGPAARQPTLFDFALPFILMIVLLWLLIFMPQRREKKRKAEMMSKMGKGDRVQTIGGILGSVVEVREHEVVVKVDESSNARLRVAKGAIAAILADGKPTETGP
ncbi:MAG: preprotein translocase subunit YajC [Phycisphaerae bacterium]|nr:preprotein translocase subunit YajC [Phycisphaerae bacterium]